MPKHDSAVTYRPAAQVAPPTEQERSPPSAVMPAPSSKAKYASGAVRSAGVGGGATSSLVMVSTAVVREPRVAPLAPVSTRLTVSSPSTSASFRIVTRNDLLVSPAANDSVPDAAA